MLPQEVTLLTCVQGMLGSDPSSANSRVKYEDRKTKKMQQLDVYY